MLCYVLNCVVALMFYVKIINAINFEPINPFSDTFFRKVADFDKIIEPNFCSSTSNSLINLREISDQVTDSPNKQNYDTTTELINHKSTLEVTLKNGISSSSQALTTANPQTIIDRNRGEEKRLVDDDNCFNCANSGDDDLIYLKRKLKEIQNYFSKSYQLSPDLMEFSQPKVIVEPLQDNLVAPADNSLLKRDNSLQLLFYDYNPLDDKPLLIRNNVNFKIKWLNFYPIIKSEKPFLSLPFQKFINCPGFACNLLTNKRKKRSFGKNLVFFKKLINLLDNSDFKRNSLDYVPVLFFDYQTPGDRLINNNNRYKSHGINNNTTKTTTTRTDTSTTSALDASSSSPYSTILHYTIFPIQIPNIFEDNYLQSVNDLIDDVQSKFNLTENESSNTINKRDLSVLRKSGSGFKVGILLIPKSDETFKDISTELPRTSALYGDLKKEITKLKQIPYVRQKNEDKESHLMKLKTNIVNNNLEPNNSSDFNIYLADDESFDNSTQVEEGVMNFLVEDYVAVNRTTTQSTTLGTTNEETTTLSSTTETTTLSTTTEATTQSTTTESTTESTTTTITTTTTNATSTTSALDASSSLIEICTETTTMSSNDSNCSNRFVFDSNNFTQTTSEMQLLVNKSENPLINKIENLEEDLKLVNQVQTILTNLDNKKKFTDNDNLKKTKRRNKRITTKRINNFNQTELDSRVKNILTELKVYEQNLKKKQEHELLAIKNKNLTTLISNIYDNNNNNNEDELSNEKLKVKQLGKILNWKNSKQHLNTKRFLFKHKKKKKRKRKKKKKKKKKMSRKRKLFNTLFGFDKKPIKHYNFLDQYQNF